MFFIYIKNKKHFLSFNFLIKYLNINSYLNKKSKYINKKKILKLINKKKQKNE